MKEIKLKFNNLVKIADSDNLEKLLDIPTVYYEVDNDSLKLKINAEKIIFKFEYDRDFVWKLYDNTIYTNNFDFRDKTNELFGDDFWNDRICSLLIQAFQRIKFKRKGGKK